MTDYLLLDVDGVLNATGRPRNLAFETTVTIQGHVLAVPAGTREWVADLEQRFAMVWATTWEDDAPGMLAGHFGFGADWPWIPMRNFAKSPRLTSKLPPVRWWLKQNLSRGDRFAWVDDGLLPDAWTWAASSGWPSLLLAPPTLSGWTWRHVQELLAFAAR